MEKILNKKIIAEGKKMALEEVQIDFDNGKITAFERILFQGNSSATGVMIAAIDADDYLYLIEQYQVGSEKRELVLPRGGIPDGRTPEEQANTELQEEAGVKAGKLEKVGVIEIVPGYMKARSILYLATDLEDSKITGDEIESVRVVKLKFTEAVSFIMSGKITDSRTIAGILMVKEYLKK